MKMWLVRDAEIGCKMAWMAPRVKSSVLRHQGVGQHEGVRGLNGGLKKNCKGLL